jgi:hypothetical protein
MVEEVPAEAAPAEAAAAAAEAAEAEQPETELPSVRQLSRKSSKVIPFLGSGRSEALEEEEHPQERLRYFIDAFAAHCDPSAEFEQLVTHFLLEIDDDISSTGAVGVTGAAEDDEGDGRRATSAAENLIEQLQPRSDQELDVHQAVTCAKVLSACLEQSEGAALTVRQEKLSALGACAVVVRLISCETSELYRAGLELGTQMVRDGNTSVQRAIYELINSADLQHVSPLDASGGNFFTRIRDALRLAMKEIPERITYLSNQACL